MNPEKPKTIRHALLALWIWTAWTFVFGVYQSLSDMPELENTINGTFKETIDINPNSVLLAGIAGYGLLAAATAWFILKIGQGKNWARASLLVSFIIDAALTLAPPYHGFVRFLWDVPDLALQIYALYLLYTAPGKAWFTRAESHEGKRPWWA
jgi:preprotein translocase subunit Sec61beta